MAPGFTLLETLVAVLLLAFLTIGLATALKLGLALPTAADGRQQVMPVAAAQGFLRREMSAALALPSVEWRGVAFAGAPREMEWVAAMPERAASPGLNEVGLFLKDGSLMLRWRRLVPAAAATERVLVPDVVGVEMDYWGSTDGRAPAGWHQRWATPAVLPLLVRVRARLAEGRGDWPDLVVALPANPDQGGR